MEKRLLWIVLAIALILLGVAWYRDDHSATPPQPVATAPSQISPDLYPLYAGATWSAPQNESVTIGTTTYLGTSMSSAALSAGMDPGSVFTPFEDYYSQKLEALGWSVANDLAAGGPVGGQTGYTKDGAVILTRFSVVYHTVSSTSPSTCPCDVTLSLFSASTSPQER